MNVNLNTPLNINLVSALLIQEGDGMGTLQFRILEQPVTLVFTTSDYTYDTLFNVGNRVKLTKELGYFGIGSEGVIQEIIIDSTDDKADVYFDKIYPDNKLKTCGDTINILSANISLKFRVPLNFLQKI